MKKTYLFLIVTLLSVFILGCSKDDEEADNNPTYNIEDWLGHYKGESNGEITLTYEGQTQSEPIETDMEFDIEKGSQSNQIIMTDEFGDSVSGTISGNKVTFEELSETMTLDGISMVLYNNMTGTFNGSSITIVQKISGTATYLGIEMPVTGTVTTVAEKQ